MVHMEYFTVYVTCANEEEARRIGRQVVEERLAACANLLGKIESFYHWEGKLQQDAEFALLLKTTGASMEQLMGRVKELHSYQVPCLVAWPIAAGHQPYLDWLAGQCTPEGKTPAAK